MKFALISGSLRKASYNRSLLRVVESLLPSDVDVVWVDIDLPLYNQDVEDQVPLPPSVLAFRAALKDADAVLFGTPEYNYGIPGTVKNAIDWGSRPPKSNAWKRLPVGVIGASPGFMGTPRAQQMLKTCLLMVGARVFSDMEILVAHAHERFNDDGELTDADTRSFVESYVDQFIRFVTQQRD